MEKLGKSIAIMLASAALVGLLVILFNPTYRKSAVCVLKGESTNSPIWQSNSDYYPDLVPKTGEK